MRHGKRASAASRAAVSAALGALALSACGDAGERAAQAPAQPDPQTAAQPAPTLDEIAERYVKTALAFRRYDDAYVDAYFGPEAWAAAAEARNDSLAALEAEAETLADAIELIVPGADDLVRRRHAVLSKRIESMRLRMDMADGVTVPFDEESAVLFDAVAPDNEADTFADTLRRIDGLLPGDGPLGERLDRFRAGFEIPKDRLQRVFDAAIEECRARTLEHIELPADERFTIEYVTDQPWSGYNWYEGDHYSLIQINTDLPIYISRAVDLGCHEGYPGHHTYNVLVEQELVDGRGWIEFTLNPLYGPQSLISEGSANFGIDMAFPDEERRMFEKDVLFPLAGLDPSEADRYYDVLETLDDLSYAGNEAARAYLNGDMSAAEAAEWLMEYSLSSRAQAEQRVRFFDTYRSYVINYNLGHDLIEAYIARLAGDDTERRWEEFERILSEPITPSDLQ